MIGPSFKLQIVHPDGEPLVLFEGGSPVETLLVEAIAKAVTKTARAFLTNDIVKQGVGVLRTEAHVREAIDKALINELPGIVTSAVKDVLLELKRETVKALYVTYPRSIVELDKNYVYDVNTMTWVRMTQPLIDGGDVSLTIANPLPVSIANGVDVTQGAIADAAVTTDAAGTLSAKLRGLVKWAYERMPASLGQKAMTASLPVTLANDQSALPVTGTFFQATQPVSGTFFQVTQPVSIAATLAVKEVRSATATQSTVNDSASNVTLLASNANRLGASISNDSSAILYLKLGATASLTSYTAQVFPKGHYEVPAGYTGIIDGIWATDPNDGAARVTELT